MLKNIFVLILTLLSIVLLGVFVKYVFPLVFVEKYEKKQFTKEMRSMERIFDDETISFNLLDPEMAPPSIHHKVMFGYNIIRHTNKVLSDHVDDRLTCANCHFASGNTLGGKRGGISLVGVVKTYPRYEARFGKVIDLVDRINNCFERSMNGKALKQNSREMQAILAYLNWIASEIPDRKSYPWLGLVPLKSQHVANPEHGAEVYQKYCMMCHQKNGEGNENNPPVWGPHAFNDGAGMSKQTKLASFIFYNMPLDDPFLTEEQAIDVAEFIIMQRRPKFEKK